MTCAACGSDDAPIAVYDAATRDVSHRCPRCQGGVARPEPGAPRDVVAPLIIEPPIASARNHESNGAIELLRERLRTIEGEADMIRRMLAVAGTTERD